MNVDLSLDFDSSEIGTKEYWDKTYDDELKNFCCNGNIGDIWFGEDSILKVVDWMVKQIGVLLTFEDSVLDIGCGNGMTLFYLSDAGFQNLYGIDYSESAVSLAKAMAEKRGTPVFIEGADIVKGESDGDLLLKTYKLCLDKGTYDAISLCPEEPVKKMESYVKNVSHILSSDGFFIITSCNWTEDELVKHFHDCKF